MPRSAGRLMVVSAVVSLLSACGAPAVQIENSVNDQCSGGPVSYALTIARDYSVTSVRVKDDGCGLKPELLLGAQAWIDRSAEKGGAVVNLQNARSEATIVGGALGGDIACNQGQLGSYGIGDMAGCRYTRSVNATAVVDAPDRVTLDIRDNLTRRAGCTPAADSCASTYSVQLERRPTS